MLFPYQIRIITTKIIVLKLQSPLPSKEWLINIKINHFYKLTFNKLIIKPSFT